MFFSTCWVRVEPPKVARLPVKKFSVAEAVRVQSTPLCSKNRWSSMATAACHRASGISSKSTQIRFSSP